jgi:hypothetical protein
VLNGKHLTSLRALAGVAMLYVCETDYVLLIIEIYLYVFYHIIHLIFITVIGLFF